MSTRSSSFWKRTGLTVGGFVVVAAVCSQIYISQEAEKIEAQAVNMQAIKTMVPPNRTYAATIIGATGAVGGEVLKELLKSPHCAHVTSLGRRKKDEFDSLEGAEKLTQLVIDFDDIEKEVELLKEHEVAFITLGVGAPSKTTLDEVYKVDVEYSAAFARACKRAGVRHISLLSSVGTPSNGRKYSEGKPPGRTAAAGSAAYMMMKSMIQDAILQLEFDRASMFQPSLLATKESRFGIGDSIMQTVFPKISWLLPTPFHEVAVEDLGRAMRINAEWGLEKKGYEILTREQFTDLLALEKEKDNI